MPTTNRPPEPWDRFFKELDSAVNTMVQLDCIGGFVVTLLYGMERPTADVDVVELAPEDAGQTVMELGGLGSPLCKKYLVYIHRVAIAAVPEN